MTKQEAYVELRKRLDEINELVTEAKAFARTNELQMGQPRWDTARFEVADPEKVWNSSGCTIGDDDKPNPDNWIGSEICW